jgi:hypothetical protein
MYNLSSVVDLQTLGTFFNTMTGEIGWTVILFTLFAGMFISLYLKKSPIALSASALISLLFAFAFITLGWISPEVFTIMAVLFLGSLLATYLLKE